MSYKRASLTPPSDIQVSAQDVDNYRRLLLAEMKRLEADESDVALVNEDMIANVIINHNNPEDLAWAVLIL